MIAKNYRRYFYGISSSISAMICSLLASSASVMADESLDVAAAAASYQETLCTQFPDRSSGSQGQKEAGEWIYETLVEQGCTVFIANSKQVQGDYMDTSLSENNSDTGELEEETDVPEAPTGSIFLNGIPYIYVPDQETSSAEDTTEEMTVEESKEQPFISPLTADNYIVHFDGSSDETLFLACYYDTAAAYTLDDTPADTGTSAVALLMALSAQFATEDIQPYYSIDIGFFDDSAKARAGEYQFFEATSQEYRDSLVGLIEFDCLIGDRNCLYNASDADQLCSDLLTASARVGAGFLMLDDVASEEALAEASATPVSMLRIPVAKIEASRWFDSDQQNTGYATYGTHLYQSAAGSLYQYSGQISGTEAEYYNRYSGQTDLVDRYNARCTDIYLTLMALLSQ